MTRILLALSFVFSLLACGSVKPDLRPPEALNEHPSFAAPKAPGTKAYLEPPQILAMLEESKVMYRFKEMPPTADMKPERLLAEAYPEKRKPLVLPTVIVRDGERHLVEFPVKPEAGAELVKGEAFFRQRDLAQAVVHYKRALSLQPDLYLAISHLGDCALFGGRPAEAMGHYDRAIGINPWDFRSYFYRANTLAAMGRWEEAKDDFIEALARAPRRASVLNVLEQHRSRLGLRVHRELFWPKACARREGKEVAICVQKGVNASPAWTAYGACKAIWLGEPAHRIAVAGSADLVYSNHEDRECFMNLLGMYKAMRERGHADAEPQLDRLWEIALAKHLDSFLVYEFITRISPHTVLLSGEEGIARMKDFIRRWVIVSAS